MLEPTLDRPLSRSEILLHSHELALQLGKTEEDIQVAISRTGPGGRAQRELLWSYYTDAFLFAFNEEAAAQALYSLALLLDDDQRDPRMLLRMAARVSVSAQLAHSPTPPSRFQVRASTSACTACARASGRNVPATDAEKAALVPNPGCTRTLNSGFAFCRCRYVAVPARVARPAKRKPANRPSAVIEGELFKPGRTRSLLGDVQSG